MVGVFFFFNVYGCDLFRVTPSRRLLDRIGSQMWRRRHSEVKVNSIVTQYKTSERMSIRMSTYTGTQIKIGFTHSSYNTPRRPFPDLLMKKRRKEEERRTLRLHYRSPTLPSTEYSVTWLSHHIVPSTTDGNYYTSTVCLGSEGLDPWKKITLRFYVKINWFVDNKTQKHNVSWFRVGLIM